LRILGIFLSLDIFGSGRGPGRIRDISDPDVLAQEIVEDFEAAPGQFREIAADLGAKDTEP
jgi:hypothetical protein